MFSTGKNLQFSCFYTDAKWPLPVIIFKFLNNDFADCRRVSITAKNIAKLTAGKVSRRIIAKFCQYVAIEEKSENISEKKLANPDWFMSEISILKDGINPIKDITNVAEKMIVFLKTKKRSSR